ncbi:uncharacterized protein LOC116695175 isoform X2 [Etheostoma spectabile]|uniref:uncharacterized protein LOC116695175 isoform X2 n=1 Tax=Etheostoma spectabile TaxID=54343 RepID=UPI0013AEE6A7|nr:uncharacterized protein LOC116695175 isoform X2 [Etheostoma spectabile]
MGGLHIFLVLLSGVVSHSLSGSLLMVRVRSGDNITLYCDCKVSSGEHIVWYRNCSHENQPSLILNVKALLTGTAKIPPHFQFVRNFSSGSYNLLITNISDSDEGLYYCGTEQLRVDYEEYITQKSVYRYGNVTTKIVLDSNSCPDSSGGISNHLIAVSCMMAFTPAFTIFSSFISFILVYHFCQRTVKEPQILRNRPDTSGQTRRDQDEDVFLTKVMFQSMDG